MRTNILFIIVFLCVLPSCLSRKRADVPVHESTSDDNDVASSPDQEESKKSSFFKRNKERRQERKKTLSNKSYLELRDKQQECIRSGDTYLALKYTEQMYNQCDDMQELCDLMLTLGDLCFAQKNYKKAAMLFSEFVRAYPGSPHVEHATFYGLLCSFEQQTTTPDRDQTTTKETIVLAQAFLKHADFTTHKAKVNDILYRCQQRLLDHEMGIVNFYIRKGSLNAANKRLSSIRQDFITHFTDAEPQVLLQECRLAYAQNNADLAQQKALELATKFPQYLQHDRAHALPELAPLLHKASLVVAHNQNDRSSFVDRF